jgi:hypothetical protein
MTVHEGGQGLAEPESRVAAFRLKAVQRLLYHTDVGWREPACALLRRAGGLGLDWQLFLMRLERLSTAGLSDFYSAELKDLAATKAHTRRGVGAWAVGVGGAYLPQPSHPYLPQSTLQSRMMAVGLLKLGDLRLLR